MVAKNRIITHQRFALRRARVQRERTGRHSHCRTGHCQRDDRPQRAQSQRFLVKSQEAVVKGHYMYTIQLYSVAADKVAELLRVRQKTRERFNAEPGARRRRASRDRTGIGIQLRPRAAAVRRARSTPSDDARASSQRSTISHLLL